MRSFLLCLMLVSVVVVFADAPLLHTAVSAPSTERNTPRTLVYSDDFESTTNTWTTTDGSAPTTWNEAWHLSTVGAYAGNSWWMGDEDLGGYTNHRYLVLDTPLIVVPTSQPTLAFNLAYACEGLGGTDNYDAWDGCNVRISTDYGDSWQVLSGSPAYNASSIYAFGSEFSEGPNTPGWSGESNGWLNASFDLTAYAGQVVMVRFAFASDPATCTGTDHPGWFGMRVDNIALGDFLSNGDGATGDSEMIPGYGGAIGGDYWSQVTDYSYSPTHAMRCEAHPNLQDELVSPIITLPASDNIFLDYWVRFVDPDVDSNGDGLPDDYYAVYAKSVGNPSDNPPPDPAWTRIHYDYDHNANGWVHIDPDYADAVFGETGNCDLSAWQGKRIQLKFVLITDGDATATGQGLWIDDVEITASNSPHAPSISASLCENQTAVLVSWISSSAADALELYGGRLGEAPTCLYTFTSQDSPSVVLYPPAGHSYSYVMRARNADLYSDFSAPAIVFLPTSSAVCVQDDQGIGDTTYTPPVAQEALMPLTAPDTTIPWFLTHISLYLAVPGTNSLNLIVRADDNNAPGALLSNWMVAVSELQVGWNTVELSTSLPVSAGQRLWIGVMGTQGGLTLRADANDAGWGMVGLPGNYTTLDTDLWIHAWFDVAAEAGDTPVQPVANLRLRNAPNPFNPETTIYFSLPQTTRTTVSLYNLRGERVATLYRGQMTAGDHSLRWNGRDDSGHTCASGLYFCRLEAGEQQAVHRMTLLK